MTRSRDPRPVRTREALIRAFNDLVLNTDIQPIRVSDIVQRADVSRSTFYEHYEDADALHREALAGPMSVLADALVGRESADRLVAVLEHFRLHRQRAIATFNSPSFRDQATGVLAMLLAARMGDRSGEPSQEIKLASWQLAEATLGLVRIWFRGDVECETDQIAGAILRASAWRDSENASVRGNSADTTRPAPNDDTA